MKDARRSSWRSYVSKVNSSTPLPLVWKRVKKICGKFSSSSPPVLRINGNLMSAPDEVASALADHFCQVSRRDPSKPYAANRREQERQGLNFNSHDGESYNVDFSLRELRAALSECGDTAPGHDDIPYAMLRHLPDAALDFLLDIYNRVWSEGLLPESWKLGIVLPFPKPGKDHTDASNYRPICLTPCLCKLFEKMVNVRLVWFLEKGGHLSPSQSGFRKFRSTSDNLIRLESSICEAFASKQHLVAVLFDLEKAYDTAWRHGILRQLHAFGLRGRLPVLLRDFLSGRVFRVRVGSTLSAPRVQEEGVPQGSVLSVSLFAVAINGIIDSVPAGVSSSLYVDDLAIWFSGSRMSAVERRLQLTLDKVSTWADSMGLRFSPSKTVAIHFCRLKGIHPDPDLELYGRRLRCVDEARFLGLTFDSRLTWVPHLRYLKASCMKALNLLRVLSHTSWGADQKTLLHLFQAFVSSKLSYGCEVYSSATASRLKTLDAVHHAGLRLVTGAFRSSPIPSLLVEAGVPPLDLLRQSAIVRCWLRVRRLPDSLVCECVSQQSCFQYYNQHPSMPRPFGFRVREAMEEFGLSGVLVKPVLVPRVPPWALPEVTFCSFFAGTKASVAPQVLCHLFQDHSLLHSGTVPVYTDGSRSSDGVGFGVVFPNFSQGGSLPLAASIFTAELTAIILALKLVFVHQDTHFTIFSDSFGALCALKSFNNPHPIVLAILEWLFLIHRRGKRVDFCWVPAHVGVKGNERVDAVAKAAALNPAPTPYSLPAIDFRASITAAVRACWQSRWSCIATNKLREITQFVFQRVYTPMPRRYETALVRLRIGHTRLTHEFLMCGGVRPSCNDCMVPLTIKHLLVECPSLSNLRSRFLQRHRRADGSYYLSSMLGAESGSPDGGLFLFLEKADLLRYL